MSRPGGIATQAVAELWHDQGWPRQRVHRHPWLARAMHRHKRLLEKMPQGDNLHSSAAQRHAQFGTKCPREQVDLEDCEGCGRSNLTILGTCPAVCRLSRDGKEFRSPCQILNLEGKSISAAILEAGVKGTDLCTCGGPRQMPLQHGRGSHIGRRECQFHTKALGPPGLIIISL
jgi:hypothetical protein